MKYHKFLRSAPQGLQGFAFTVFGGTRESCLDSGKLGSSGPSTVRRLSVILSRFENAHWPDY